MNDHWNSELFSILRYGFCCSPSKTWRIVVQSEFCCFGRIHEVKINICLVWWIFTHRKYTHCVTPYRGFGSSKVPCLSEEKRWPPLGQKQVHCFCFLFFSLSSVLADDCLSKGFQVIWDISSDRGALDILFLKCRALQSPFHVHSATVMSGNMLFTYRCSVMPVALSKRKCPYYLIEIISSLFLDRVKIIKTSKGKYSCVARIGCPQEGVLSSFLWIILAEELICLSNPFPLKVIGYVDDKAIVCWHNVIKIAMRNLQIIVNDTIITNCDRYYLLDINALKTILMIFSNKKKQR